MMLHGYCIDCHKIKRVRISSAGMARVAAGQTPVGECGCREELEQRRRRNRERSQR